MQLKRRLTIQMVFSQTDIAMKTFEVTHLIYSVSDNVTGRHDILQNC